MIYNYIIIGLIILYVISSIIFISIIIRNKKKNKQLQKIANRPVLNINERLNATNSLFDFIDYLIELEIVNKRRFEIFLQQPNKNLDVDDVLKDVATTVFEAIREDVFVDLNNIVTTQYLMTYIQKKTFLFYIQYIENNVASQL